MANVSMLGTGMMGSGMAEAMLGRGESVTVWNRTIAKAEPLRARGARVEPDAKAAVAGAERIHIMLSDDASVDALLAQIADVIPKNAYVIDHTTVTPMGTAERVKWCTARGITFIHAPVFMSPQACRESTGVMLASGSQAIFSAVEAELKKMTGDLWYVGERPDKAAAFKLMGNMMLFFISDGLAEMYTLAKATGIAPQEAFELFSHFNPGGAIKMRGAKMAAADFKASFELTMARKDLRLMLETAQHGGASLRVLAEIGAVMDQFIKRGEGDKDVAVLASDAVRQPTPA